MFIFIKNNWFMLGLLGIAAITISDAIGLLVVPGLWLAAHRGPDAVIILIFFFSGIALDAKQIRAGVTDYPGTILTLVLIFVISPLIAMAFSLLPLATGIILGLYLVAVMPSTLSSGVVMTGSAGGNMAHALLITIIANALAVITIPVTLSFLLGAAGDGRAIAFDQSAIMIKIATLVLLPLLSGTFLRSQMDMQLRRLLPYTTIANQVAVLVIVWMALCSGRVAIVAEMNTIIIVLAAVFGFHLVLVLMALGVTKVAGIPKGRRESIIFMGGQKTLPLSVILQVTLFPEYGVALVVCVVHHIVHLIMDAFLIGYLREKQK
ncbi:MAG: bile acid:sodium symporter [Proteobacteria bacterium]|nr:bile acid:sodium symporter [Pseudomonadota bacterium]